MASSYFNWGGSMFGGVKSDLQSTGMLTKEQLRDLFRDFSNVLDQPETKRRIADAVRAKQEAVNVTTEIQEELFFKMGVDPKFGIDCLGKVNVVYANDRDLMIQFYQFVSREEMACEEAELGPEAFARKTEEVKKFQQEQMRTLQQLRGLPVGEQQAVLQGLQAKMHEAQSSGGSAMTPQEIQEFFARQHQAHHPKDSHRSPDFSQSNLHHRHL